MVGILLVSVATIEPSNSLAISWPFPQTIARRVHCPHARTHDAHDARRTEPQAFHVEDRKELLHVLHGDLQPSFFAARRELKRSGRGAHLPPPGLLLMFSLMKVSLIGVVFFFIGLLFV